MSQAKVEHNKELKANRKKINQKNKLKKMIATTVTAIVCVAIVFWIGFSFYNKSMSNDDSASKKIEVDLTAINDYIDNIEE